MGVGDCTGKVENRLLKPFACSALNILSGEET